MPKAPDLRGTPAVTIWTGAYKTARHTASLDANGMREILLAEKRRALSSRDEVLQTPRCLAILRSPRHPHGERRARRFSGIGWVQAPSGTEDSPDHPEVQEQGTTRGVLNRS
jgi:hypothetical protein